MSDYLNNIVPLVMDDFDKRARKALYLRDPEAWMWDVLGKRWWSKQREIAWSVVENKFTVVKSCNGVGKSQLGADLATWFAAVHDPRETTVMISMPIAKQITTVAFRYINENIRLARERGFTMPGRTTQEPAWKVDALDGKEIVQAKRPADENLISSFQGIHDANVMVLLDEAGGLPEDLWIGANAVTTNEYVRILGIGNPDEINTGFHRRFIDRDRFSDWTLKTISALDSPNFTGELIYPDDLERDSKIKSLLVQRDWADMMIRQAHPSVVQAKVYGEFPSDSDRAFFPQSTINKAYETEITPPEDAKRCLGVDLSFEGDDKSTAYMNIGGRVRKVDEWSKIGDYMEAARRVHQAALSTGAEEVRIDAAGPGGGVFSNLQSQPEFYENAPYVLIGIKGSFASPDPSRWAQARAWHFDQLRDQMNLGLIDLDDEDRDLRDQLQSQTFKINNRGAIQITPKDEARKAGIHSPDHLDGAIYATLDTSAVTDNPLSNLGKGDVVTVDPWAYLQAARSGPGMPI